MDPREEILRQVYPRIANLQEQVQLTYWSEHHLVPQDLLDVLPFGHPFRAIGFYHYIDYQLADILTAARCCTAYWLLTHVGDSLLLMAVKVNDGLELEVTDPQENQGEVEQEDGES